MACLKKPHVPTYVASDFAALSTTSRCCRATAKQKFLACYHREAAGPSIKASSSSTHALVYSRPRAKVPDREGGFCETSFILLQGLVLYGLCAINRSLSFHCLTWHSTWCSLCISLSKQVINELNTPQVKCHKKCYHIDIKHNMTLNTLVSVLMWDINGWQNSRLFLSQVKGRDHIIRGPLTHIQKPYQLFN